MLCFTLFYRESKASCRSIRSGLGECLTDDPRNPPEKFKYPDMLPGAMYDGNFQCDMNFPGSKICPGDTGVYFRIFSCYL